MAMNAILYDRSDGHGSCSYAIKASIVLSDIYLFGLSDKKDKKGVFMNHS